MTLAPPPDLRERPTTRRTLPARLAGNFLWFGAGSSNGSSVYAIIGIDGRDVHLRLQRFDGSAVTGVSTNGALLPLDLENSFHHLSVEYSTSAPGQLNVRVDDTTIPLDVPPDYLLTGPAFAVGPYCAAKGQGHVVVDDVAVWLEK